MIEIEKLRVRAGSFTLEVEELNVGRGEYMVVMGPNGAGKTVLLETIAGFRRPISGKIVIDGVDVTFKPPEKRAISFVPQNLALWPHMTVFENISYGLKIRGIDKNEVKRKVLEISEIMKIKHLLDRRVTTLSGGEKQKVALARALVISPKAVLLDEPLSNLDKGVAEKLKSFIKEIRREVGFTAIHVTHDPIEAAELGDRVAVMLNGRILQVGEPIEVMRNPKSLEIASLYGGLILLKGKIVEVNNELVKVDINGKRITALSKAGCKKGGKALISLKPEDIGIFTEEPKMTSLRNVLECVIEDIKEKGSLVHLTLTSEGMRLESLITRGSFEHLELRKGKRVFAVFKASAARVISYEP